MQQKDKYMTTLRIGQKGQIVIPKEVRDMFGLNAGDGLLLMADKAQGIALSPIAFAEAIWAEVEKLKSKNGD